MQLFEKSDAVDEMMHETLKSIDELDFVKKVRVLEDIAHFFQQIR